jgi:hypothetical protein
MHAPCFFYKPTLAALPRLLACRAHALAHRKGKPEILTWRRDGVQVALHHIAQPRQMTVKKMRHAW